MSLDLAIVLDDAGDLSTIDVVGTLALHVPLAPLALPRQTVHVTGDDGYDFFSLGTGIGNGLLQIPIAPIPLARPKVPAPDTVRGTTKSSGPIMSKEDQAVGVRGVHLCLDQSR